MGHFYGDNKTAEIGDILLILRKKEIDYYSYKFSFLQAKRITPRKVKAYAKKHDSFRADKDQDDHIRNIDQIYINRNKLLKNATYNPSIVNYLIFYRNSLFYDIDVTTVQNTIKPSNSSKTITLGIRSKKYMDNINGNIDFNYASGFIDFYNAMNSFSIGEELSYNSYKALRPYLKQEITNKIDESFPDIDYDDENRKNKKRKNKTILVDVNNNDKMNKPIDIIERVLNAIMEERDNTNLETYINDLLNEI